MNTHFEDAIDIIAQTFGGQRRQDEHTPAAAAILAERLDRIRQFGGLFEQITLSPQMESLLSRHCAAAAV